MSIKRKLRLYDSYLNEQPNQNDHPPVKDDSFEIPFRKDWENRVSFHTHWMAIIV